MDTYEATKLVMSRVQGLDPENASKIMGYILIQDLGEKEMIRLAFGTEALLLSYINQARAFLGLPCSTPHFPPRILVPNNGLHLSNPSSPGFHRATPTPSPRPFSYAAAVNGGTTSPPPPTTTCENVSRLGFYGGGNGNPGLDDLMVDPIMSPSGRSDSFVNEIPSPHPNPFHRRSCSVNDAAVLLSNLEDGGGGFGWKPCMYFARGFCKNGTTCKFLHSDGEAVVDMVGSPNSSVSGFDELLRMKALQHHQRLALMASGGHHPFAFNRNFDFLNDNPRSDFSQMELILGANSSSRQIYLTFPADSTFKEEDVSNYFSIYGPVQDVRIPYQQKRMFGFVTFVYAETVKQILAKGNPHFVCDSRVLVKPYKEKGKVLDRKQQQHQHMERGDYSACLSPTRIDAREDIDAPFGSRMMYGTREMMLRRKLEEVELQHAIELQGRRMMNLQLMDLKSQQHNNPHFLPSLRSGIPMSPTGQPQLPINQNSIAASDSINKEDSEGMHRVWKSPILEGIESSSDDNKLSNGYESNVPESRLEHILPDNLFTSSPTKVGAEQKCSFSQASSSSVNDTISNNNIPASACYIKMPRLSSGKEGVQM